MREMHEFKIHVIIAALHCVNLLNIKFYYGKSMFYTLLETNHLFTISTTFHFLKIKYVWYNLLKIFIYICPFLTILTPFFFIMGNTLSSCPRKIAWWKRKIAQFDYRDKYSPPFQVERYSCICVPPRYVNDTWRRTPRDAPVTSRNCATCAGVTAHLRMRQILE